MRLTVEDDVVPDLFYFAVAVLRAGFLADVGKPAELRALGATPGVGRQRLVFPFGSVDAEALPTPMPLRIDDPSPSSRCAASSSALIGQFVAGDPHGS